MILALDSFIIYAYIIMPPKRKFKRKGNALAKRVSILETKQKADDKNVEYKSTYQAYQQFISTSSSSVSSMGPRTRQGVQGETAVNAIGGDPVRIGNEINLRHYVVTGYVKLPTNSDGQLTGGNLSNVNCRIIFADNLTDTTQLSLANVLQDTGTVPRALNSPYKNKITDGKRYKILADYKFNLDVTHGTKRFKFRMPLPKSGRVLHYDGDANEDPSDLNISVISICDVAPLSANQPDMLWTVKTRFTDS